jgi:DNA-binding response OmpR family regulator
MPKKILSVEDEPAIFELVRRKLVRAGFEVLHAEDGEEALERVSEDRPDLILLDIGLGEFSPDGWEINRRLKQDPATATIPVIALTAHGQRDDHRERALREGFVENVGKPIDFEELMARISAALEAGGASL